MIEKETIDEHAAQMKVFPLDELHKYAGKCIAWSPDGTSIVAGADDYDILDRAVCAAGYDPSRCVFSYVDGESSI